MSNNEGGNTSNGTGNRTVLKIGGIALSVFGGFFLFLSLLFTVIFVGVGGIMNRAIDSNSEQLEEFKEYALTTEGEIVEAYGGTTTVRYYPDGEDTYYDVVLSVNSSNYSEGTTVTVYYNAENPGECMVPEIMEGTYGMLSNIFTMLGGGIGIVLLLVGLISLIIGIVLVKKSKNGARQA